MPVYLFTFHAYASWMPDHRRGYVHRKNGLKPHDPKMGANYRNRLSAPAVTFDSHAQQVLISAAREAVKHLDAKLFFVATEWSHAHLLLSWEHERPWSSMRRSLRYALTLTLNASVTRRKWFSQGASRKRVRGVDHFDYLLLAYLPDHHGESFADVSAITAAQRRDAERRVSVVTRFERYKARRLKRIGRA